MLCELKIENVAVIEKAAVRFDRGLNVLSGETGAGKSILIDSINTILGNRKKPYPQRQNLGHISRTSEKGRTSN